MIWRYRLKARGFLNTISNRREFEGVLIRIDGGFGCIHPWPELGDPPLEKCLADLAGVRRWPVVRRAIRCAGFDRVARSHEDSLFEDLEVPDSHATLSIARADGVARAVEAGFGIIKLKTGRNPSAEAQFVNEMSNEYPALRWRLDFNEALDPEAAAGFFAGLSIPAKAAVDFAEDPCPYSDQGWTALRQRTGMRLAVDREAAPHRTSAQVMVVKPAVDEPILLAEAALRNHQRIVVTSYMDHPLGQAFAAWEAARLGLQFPGLVGVCGLQTHHLFQPDGFSELLGSWSPVFQPPAGTGLGFDDLLDALPWTRLY